MRKQLLLAFLMVTTPLVAACGPPKVNGYVLEPGADLSGAYLWDADLEGVNLAYADLTGANLESVKWDWSTKDPRGWLK